MPLNAISPIDGRYHSKVRPLSNFFSEAALIKYRILVEIEYFIALSNLGLEPFPSLEAKNCYRLRALYQNFTSKDACRVKEIEKKTNHDVKAVEYFIKEKFEAFGLVDVKEFVHFGLTSQDINNVAIPLSIRDSMQVYKEELGKLKKTLEALAETWKGIPMLARTHGQPASPTLLGKEIRIFVVRLEEQLDLLKSVKIAAKFGGAVGNYNAHNIAFPKIDWKTFGTNFVENILKLHHSFPTTQIEHYDHLAALFDTFKRINTIIIDLNRDIWTYISMDYFKQQIKKGEIGSSAMPHKVNPIDFENSEGNLGVANALFEHFSAKLPISRLQRDLTDSTVLRNLGVPLAHTLIAFQATTKGLKKLLLNPKKIEQDLENNWVVIAEAIQTILRREKYPNPYEALKEITRINTPVNKQVMSDFIDQLEVSDSVKKELKAISPSNYTGIF